MLCECANVQMCKCLVNVQMCKCANAWLMCEWLNVCITDCTKVTICTFAHSHICTFAKHLHIKKLYSPLIVIAVIAFVGNDNVVDELDVHRLGGFLESFGQVVIFATWLKVARRVVVR